MRQMETEEQKQQCPLGYDIHGDPLDIPESAVAWRVRRATGKPGRPQHVYDCDGRQLEIPLRATIDDLREHGVGQGRYRLEAVDNTGRLIPGVIAFTEVTDDDEEDASSLTTETDRMAHLVRALERQSDTLCRALSALATAFGPMSPAPPPVLAEPAGPK